MTNNIFDKRNFKKDVIIFLLIVSSFLLQAQEKWTLKQCINYAIENNIDLNIQKNKIANQKINLYESKANLLPDLNLGSGANFNYGRNIDANTNDITFDQTFSNNYWASSSVDLFQGFVKQNTISYNKFLLYANKEESERMKNQLIFNVITSYYTSLYSLGLENVAETQMLLSKNQFDRMTRLVEVGKESPIIAQELKSQWGADQLNYTIANNRKKQELLKLKELLRLTSNNNFEIDTLTGSDFILSSIQDKDSIFANALNILPEVKQQEFLLKASEKDLAVSKGRVSPRLYMSAGYYTGYYDGVEAVYDEQLKNNQSQQIRMGVVIPIFNNASTHSNIKRKKIALDNQKLQIEKEKEQIYAEIWRTMDNLAAAESEYYSSTEANKFAQLSFQNASKKLEKGLANTTDFESAKQRLFAAEAAQLKAKLTYVMYQQILEFYKTGSWKHL